MIIGAAGLLILSIVGLIFAWNTGSPVPGNPRHGTFGVEGLNSSFIAWSCVGMCAVGLLLVFIDSRRPKTEPREPGERGHTAGDELFGEHDVERDVTRGN